MCLNSKDPVYFDRNVNIKFYTLIWFMHKQTMSVLKHDYTTCGCMNDGWLLIKVIIVRTEMTQSETYFHQFNIPSSLLCSAAST